MQIQYFLSLNHNNNNNNCYLKTCSYYEKERNFSLVAERYLIKLIIAPNRFDESAMHLHVCVYIYNFIGMYATITVGIHARCSGNINFCNPVILIRIERLYFSAAAFQPSCTVFR